MLNPVSFAAGWWSNAFKMWEIAVAAPSVVVHRTALYPDSRNQKEFIRMGQEKIEAFGESWVAMAMHTQRLNAELASAAIRHSLSAWTALASLTGATTGQQVSRAQATLLRSIIVPGGNRKLASSLSSVMAKGLHPVHRRATANAKRLGRLKRR